MTEPLVATRYGAMNSSLPLRIVDGRRLEKRYRDALKPGAVISDSAGQAHRLPRYFYEVPSWDVALTLQLSEHFALWSSSTPTCTKRSRCEPSRATCRARSRCSRCAW